MKKSHKFLSLILFFIMVCFAFKCTYSDVYATSLSSGELFIMDGYTIRENTTINQINERFGNPKIETISVFGGSAYSYYNDNMDYYLFVETDTDGVIKAVGAFYGNFVGNLAYYRDKSDGYVYRRTGTTISDLYTSEIYGIYEYKANYREIADYWTEYCSNPDYLLALQPHGVAATKVVNKHDGYTTVQSSISEDLFYTNVQLQSNGSNLDDYANKNNKRNFIKSIRKGSSTFYEVYPNPITFASLAEKYVYDGAYEYLFFDFEIKDPTKEKYSYRVTFIDEAFQDKKNAVELTAEEKNLLEKTIAQYNKFNEIGRSLGSNYFDIEPQYSSLPLIAGKWTKGARQMATEYLNIARVGMGTRPLTLDEEISDCAQHKAALVLYMIENGMETGHYPVQPDGVPDEFYNKAMSYMNENLYQGDIQSSIDKALNDGAGDPVTCGHRYNLLNPCMTTWGVGSVGQGSFGSQACHKLSGYTSDPLVDVVAWPSKGIFPVELAYNGIGNWTIEFVNGYRTNEDTTVSIKRLNTNEVFEISKEDTSDSTGKFYESSGALYTFRDDSIIHSSGDVYEITLHNVLDTNRNPVDYTYRSVFYSFLDMTGESVTDIEIDKTNIILSPYNGIAKVQATVVPSSATNKIMKFESLDENVARVRQDGTITGVARGTTQIKVTCGNVIKYIDVSVGSNILGDVNENGIVNADDAAIVADLYKAQSWNSDQLSRGDLTNDGKLNGDDITLIIDIFKQK